MIHIVDIKNNFSDEIYNLSKHNPFGCRICSLYKTYNYNLPFVDFWVQIIENKPVSLISRLETSFVLMLTDNSDLDEISSFIRVSGAANVICDSKYKLDCNMKKSEGPILSSKNLFKIEVDFEVCTPSVKEVYSIIKKCASDNFNVPSYESFMLDVNHKLCQHTVRMYAVKKEIPVACIMTLAESVDTAVLGALATIPQYRKKGYGAFLIKYINNILIKEGKQVFLHRALNENVAFYNKLGFELYGYWAEYKE